MVKAKKHKKFSFSLPEREGEMLSRYADSEGLSRPEAVRRILKSYLSEHVQNVTTTSPKNQLDIFDSVQIDIFNNTSKS